MDPPGGKYSSSALDFTAICCPLFAILVVVVVVIRGFNFCVVFLSATTTKDVVCDPVKAALIFVVVYAISSVCVRARVISNEDERVVRARFPAKAKTCRITLFRVIFRVTQFFPRRKSASKEKLLLIGVSRFCRHAEDSKSREKR